MTEPSVCSYVVMNDSGFAPNPFHGVCTLACCKPVIRRTAKVGDIVVGLSSGCERIVYAMRVGEVLTFADYWNDPRFAAKRPMRTTALRDRQGDNIYEPVGPGRFRQLPSRHGPNDVERDLNGRNVLVSTELVYFGGPAVPSGSSKSALKRLKKTKSVKRTRAKRRSKRLPASTDKRKRQ